MSQFLTLVRHAKSSWKDPGQSDFDRTLNDRGRRDALTMSARMVSRECVPDMMLISSACRAQATASYLIDAFSLTPDQHQSIDDLYLAEPEILLEVIAGVPDSVRHLMVVAHNPGLEALSELLAGRTLPPMPTLGIRHFACPSLRALDPRQTDTHMKRPGRRTDIHKTGVTQRAVLLFDDYPKSAGD